ncbi:MAG: type II toxin-antitoxin system ParD family antitoxin [Caulobacterales bacterium]
MVVTLTNELEALVREKVASGGDRDESEVVADALKLLEERDAAKLRALLEAIDEGDADLREGRSTVVRSQADLDALFSNP